MGMYTVDRQSLIMYSEGELLNREGQYVAVCNEKQVIEAISRLESGEKVGILDNKRQLVSYMVLEDDSFVEHPIDELQK